MTTNTIQNQQQQNEEIQQETEFTHDNNINKNNPEDNNSNIEDTPTSTNHDTPIIRNKEEEMPRNIIIQQETPNPSKTKKTKKSKKTNKPILKNQTWTLEPATSTNIQQPTQNNFSTVSDTSNPNLQPPATTKTQQSTTPATSDTTKLLQQERQKRMLKSPDFQQNVKW